MEKNWKKGFYGNKQTIGEDQPPQKYSETPSVEK